jgi:hypothetical protein
MENRALTAHPSIAGRCATSSRSAALRQVYQMPELSWEPLEFLELLGVLPEEEEYGVSYHYVLARNDSRLELTLGP